MKGLTKNAFFLLFFFREKSSNYDTFFQEENNLYRKRGEITRGTLALQPFEFDDTNQK